MRALAVAAILLAAPVLAACIGPEEPCDPERVPSRMDLEPVQEDARSLPLLGSGTTTVDGQEAPDSHGALRVQTRFGTGTPHVHVHELRLNVTLDGVAVPVRVVEVEAGGAAWREDGGVWRGALARDAEMTVFWAVDRHRTLDPMDLVLPAGAPYAAALEFDWSYEGCHLRAEGTAAMGVDAEVAEPARVRALHSVGYDIFREEGGVRFHAGFGLDGPPGIEVHGAAGLVVFLPDADPDAIHVARFPAAAWQVDRVQGEPRMEPGQELIVGAPEPEALRPVPRSQAGIFLLAVEVHYLRPAGGEGAADFFGFAARAG